MTGIAKSVHVGKVAPAMCRALTMRRLRIVCFVNQCRRQVTMCDLLIPLLIGPRNSEGFILHCSSPLVTVESVIIMIRQLLCNLSAMSNVACIAVINSRWSACHFWRSP